MGRRPNFIVGEFFERGEKLADSSNRYTHTCKRCGEEFPKGRIDTLTTHLLRKCPNLSPEHRSWVFQQIQQTPESRSSRRRERTNKINPAVQHQGHDSDNQLAVHHQYQQSALDTLAEVSRRHLDYSRGSNEPGVECGESGLSETVVEQALLTELGRYAELETSIENIPPSNSQNGTVDDSVPQAERLIESDLLSASNLATSPLVKAASAANQQIALNQAQTPRENEGDSLVDPQLDGVNTQPRSRIESSNTAEANMGETEILSWQPQSEKLIQPKFPGLPMPLQTSVPGLTPSQTPSKSKKRGRFDDTRRKQVSEIRKRGACMRCRMLKKSCSGETPCSTCSTVESARLWKENCLRTRLVDEFTLWSTSLFHSRAKFELASAAHGLEHILLPGRIEVRFFAESNACLSFASRAYGRKLSGIDPVLGLDDDHALHGTDKSFALWTIDEDDSMADTLGEYVGRTADVCIEGETSLFMRATLKQARELVKAEEVDKAVKSTDAQGQQSPRSSYSVNNDLLKTVTELWVQTQWLARRDKQGLQVRYDASNVQQGQTSVAAWPHEQHTSAATIIPQSSQSWRLIHSQLLAAVESCCAKLCKTVMNELERRLLQRQQVSVFATFLCAVILLNCVERMCALYRSFEDEAGPNAWPLDTLPSSLWSQGQQFSDLLTMLLRMRALPPKTAERPDGTLAAAQDSNGPIRATGQSTKDSMDEQKKNAAYWLDSLHLSVTQLASQRDRDLPLPGYLEAWDMRFVSKLLLPEKYPR